MQRNSLVYAVVASLVFICFLSFLETKKANASLGLVPSENSWILDQWIIAEVRDEASKEDVTDQYSSEVWQFLNSNGFVQFRDRIIQNTGEWSLKNGMIIIKKDGEEKKRIYKIHKAGRNEIILHGKELKIRLLKLENL